MSGLFVTFEGGEGCGKSTQVRLVAARLAARGLQVRTTREPGGSPGAELLRETILYNDVSFSPRAEVLVHMAARADHVDHVIRPARDAGEIVLCDRFHDSTVAYQGYGLGRAREEVLQLIANARKLIACEADLTFLLEVPDDIARQRVALRQGRIDRYEVQSPAFHTRVRAGFEALRDEEPARIRPIAGNVPAESISLTICNQIVAHLEQNKL